MSFTRQIEWCRGCPFGRYGNLTDPVDLIYQHCLPVLERLASQNLTLLGFLHSHTCDLQLVNAGETGDAHIEGHNECVGQAFFFHLPDTYRGLGGITQSDHAVSGNQNLDSTQQRRDVNPRNVVIDEAMNAWLIDFAGMNNVEFGDEEKRETVEGEWQDVRRLFQEWLPSRVKTQEDD